MSHALECYQKMKWFRKETQLPCRAVINPGCITDIPVKVGQGVFYVNETFAIIYGTPS